jgi:hypothetical protein
LESDVPNATRDQLDSLIESGDWAAVGATAALLAAASDSQSATTRNSRASRSMGSRGSSVDAARAAELDHLVDAGDWEGVVLAAAKFEAATEASGAVTRTSGGNGSASKGSNRSRTNSSSQDSSVDAEDSATGTGTFTGTFDPSLSTSISDDPSRAAKLAEYRSEVEALVRRVVPEEIDNVDEMMNQFKGREEELVETLRTMQERAVAQKARQTGHKNAKLEARRTVQRGVVPGADAVSQRLASSENSNVPLSATTTAVVSSSASQRPPTSGADSRAAVAVASTAGTTGLVEVITSFPDKTKDGSPRNSIQESNDSTRRNRSALDAAIEAGDWDAVRDTAAALSVSSGTTVSSGEIDRLANTNISTTSSDGSPNSRKRQLQGVNSERAAELDAIIDSGDWGAVVSIANRFSEEDKKSSTMKASSGKMSKEEEDALREAELWMKIAEQKKSEGALDAGASDAAEWAIQRSLSQLRDAEKKSTAHQEKFHTEGEDEV